MGQLEHEGIASALLANRVGQLEHEGIASALLANRGAVRVGRGEQRRGGAHSCRPFAADRRLLVQQLLDPAQRAAQGLGVGAGAAQRKHDFELGNDGIRYGLQRFRCISLRSAMLHCVPGTIYQPKCTRFRNWSIVKRILF